MTPEKLERIAIAAHRAAHVAYDGKPPEKMLTDKQKQAVRKDVRQILHRSREVSDAELAKELFRQWR